MLFKGDEGMTRPVQLFFIGSLFALFFVYSGVNTYITFTFWDTMGITGWRLEEKSGQLLVSQVSPDGPASNKLQIGDEVVSINNQNFEHSYRISQIFRRIKPGESYSVVIKRDSQIKELILVKSGITFVGLALRIATRIAIPLIFLIAGFTVFLLKPFDKQALLLALMFALFSGFGGDYTVLELPRWLYIIMMVGSTIWQLFFPLFLHFFLIFPDPKGSPSPLLRRFPKLESQIYLPYLLYPFILSVIFNIAFVIDPDRAFDLYDQFRFYFDISNFFPLIYIVAGLLVLIINYRQASQLSQRKMRIVVAGSIAGFLPLLIFIGVDLTFNLSRININLLQWLLLPIILALTLFPISFGYAIVRHQVIPISLIIRRGVRYLLVSRGFLTVEAATIFAILSFFLTGNRIEIIDSLGSRADVVAAMGATIVATLILRFVNRRVMPIIDRRFFRETYDSQQILSDLGQAVRTVATIDEMLELAVVKIQDALHLETISIFLKNEDKRDYYCAITSNHIEGKLLEIIKYTPSSTKFLPRDAFVVEMLKESSLALTVDFQNRKSWAYSLNSETEKKDESRIRENEILKDLNSSLLLPIMTHNELIGIISLGPKLAELPFSSDDRRMLMSVAWQMAFAIENNRLIHQMAEEKRLRQELELATEVQRRLFPQRPPDVASLDLSGVCYPASGVGGDYYDFLVLDNDQIGIAVADVAGKGISAALLMSIVQASLRSQAPSINGDLTVLVSSMNRLLHRSTGPSSYATFFYAQFDEKTGILTYVNAGHNPPILIQPRSALSSEIDPSVSNNSQALVLSSRAWAMRTITTELEKEEVNCINLLDKGGVAIGLFENCAYEQETIQMQIGDLLVAYTDGVTEALNPNGEEFGEVRLRSVVNDWSHLSAGELTDKIVQSIRDWCCDTPQHDDLTLAIIKVR
jgi:phosphoserine phosphatase RsbU/P